jgi:hypothetical protein
MENIKNTMKKLLIFLLCLFPFIVNATMMTDFTEETAPATTDILWITKTPGTTPLDRKMTIATLFGISLTLSGTNIYTGVSTFKNTVNFQKSDGTPIVILPSAPSSASDLPLSCGISGTCSFATSFSNVSLTGLEAYRIVCSDSSGSLSVCDGATDGTTLGTAALPFADLYLSGTAQIRRTEVNGSTHGHLTAAQGSNSVVYNTGQTNADISVILPAAAAGYNIQYTVGTNQAGNHWGTCANTGDKIYLIAADGTISAGTDTECVAMVAAQIGQSFSCWTFKTDAYDWMCKATAIGTSTFEAHVAF